MNGGLPAEVRVRVGTLHVTAASAIEARRLADALPAAIERALRSWPDATTPAVPAPGRHCAAADRRADQVAAAIVHRMRIRLGGDGPR
ncbi:hypothetical protein RKD23_007592 [Streptomyces sp. SAI-170]|uniref:hypothetical protein n=1 Tax=Streptomyces sp. SAI-170 TaxID=3377729 RepID=UPI003C79E2EC